MGALGIACSFPLSYWIYWRLYLSAPVGGGPGLRGAILRLAGLEGGVGNGFNILNGLSLFVILGIGADDVFILCDMWTQAGVRLRAEEIARARGASESAVPEPGPGLAAARLSIRVT